MIGNTNSDMHNMLDEYNWDDGFKLPGEIIDDKECDLATALKVFYLAGGYDYLIGSTYVESEWFEFISDLFLRIKEQSFKKGKLTYTIPLTKTQVYKLRKIGAPCIFLENI